MNRFRSKIRDEHNLTLLSEYNCIEKLSSAAYEDNALLTIDVLDTLHEALLLEFGRRFIADYQKKNRID